MKKAKQFLKEKGLKDTLYNVNYNPNQNRGLPQKEWIKGGLSALLDEYAGTKVNKISPNPPVIRSVCAMCGQRKILRSDNLCQKCWDELPF
jgi:hypothetical protein